MTATEHTRPSAADVSVVVDDDGTGRVTIDGHQHPIQAGTLDAARSAAIQIITANAAQPAGVPIVAATCDPTGTHTIAVHPDGTVHAPDEVAVPADAATTAQPIPDEPLSSGGQAAWWPGSGTAPSDSADILPATRLTKPSAPLPVEQTDEPPVAAGVAPPSVPTLRDLLTTRPPVLTGPAEFGWQGGVRRFTGGLIHPAPGAAERHHRGAVAAVQRNLDGPKTVVVVNPKGGAHKTTATLLLAATFGIHRGGYCLAWDNNETRGTLGWRSAQASHSRTAVDLLRDLDWFNDVRSARVGDLDAYVRSQGSAQFDVLASDEDAASSQAVDADAFTALHTALSRFYRVMVIDTGNNMRSSNWEAAVAAADQLVIVSTIREDTAQSAAWAIDALRATGRSDVVESAVTVLSSPAPQPDRHLRDRLHDHFGKLTRSVVDVPYDPALVTGDPINVDTLHLHTREAWLGVAATVADGL